MTTGDIQSDIAAAQKDPVSNTYKSPNVLGGKVITMAGSADIPADSASGTVVDLFELLPGQRVILGGSYIGTEDALSSGVTVAVGDDDDTDAADPDRYLAATSLAAAGSTTLLSHTSLAKGPYVAQKKCLVQATFAGAVIAEGQLRFEILVASNIG